MITEVGKHTIVYEYHSKQGDFPAELRGTIVLNCNLSYSFKCLKDNIIITPNGQHGLVSLPTEVLATLLDLAGILDEV